jgi:hypothetical protein
MTAVEVAKQLLFVKEKSGANDGPWVEAILRSVGLPKGNPWCMAFVSFCMMIAFAGKSPVPQTASCDVLLKWAEDHDRTEKTPVPGDLFLVMASPTDAIHVGFVTAIGKLSFKSIEGNTNPAGGREGYGVFERERKYSDRYLFVRL